MDAGLRAELRRLRASERGPGIEVRHAPLSMVLLYPSPYRAAMSSLGFLQIHRLVNARAGSMAERAVLPEDPEAYRRTRTPLLTLESGARASEAALIGVSLAYELELAGLVTALELAGLAPLARDRGPRDPLVVLGGPLTFSNPRPAAPFADLVLLGEAEGSIGVLLDRLEAAPEAARGSGPARAALLEGLANEPGFYVPSLHGERLPALGKAVDAALPAHAALWTPEAELASMMLIEPERGCHRGCTFCVMRRSTNDGMRLVAADRVTALVPPEATRVGLVGAAVTDHPAIREILATLVDERGLSIGVSSLRADRLDDELVGLLARGGYRSMTVALDAASERLRYAIEKNLKERHVERAVELAAAHGMRHLKIYVVVNLPEETDADLDELIGFVGRLRKVLPIVLGVSPFVPKYNTPLARAAFAGEGAAKRAITRLQRAFLGGGGRSVEVRGPSAREAYVEYRLAQGGLAHAEAAIRAAAGGGRLGAWKRAFEGLPERVEPENAGAWVPLATPRRRWYAAHGA